MLSRDLDAYVSLCMTMNHPLKYLAQKAGRLPDPRYLAISQDVLKQDGVCIALGVANAINVEMMPLADALAHKKVDVEVLYQRTNWRDAAVQQRLQTVKKWEVLVSDHVPKDLIVGVM